MLTSRERRIKNNHTVINTVVSDRLLSRRPSVHHPSIVLIYTFHSVDLIVPCLPHLFTPLLLLILSLLLLLFLYPVLVFQLFLVHQLPLLPLHRISLSLSLSSLQSPLDQFSTLESLVVTISLLISNSISPYEF